jgi:xylulose-5-phosphate/fructose-6-phosphate phosphoketolase
MRLQPETEQPHGMSDAEFDALFTVNAPVVSPITAIRGLSTG